MAKFLKGNYRLPNSRKVSVQQKRSKDLTDQLEESALAKLGGSLCFVMKKNRFVWPGDANTHESAR